MKPVYEYSGSRIFHGNALEVLRAMPDRSVHCAVTSPPYWGLRDYSIESSVWDGDENCQHEFTSAGLSSQRQRNGASGGIHEGRNINKLAENITLNPEMGSFCSKCGAWLGSFGLEPTPDLYIKHAVQIFRELRRVLRDDGTLWCNIGDSYAGSGKGGHIGFETTTLEGSLTSTKEARTAGEKMRGRYGKDLDPKHNGAGQIYRATASRRRDNEMIPRSDVVVDGLKPKDLVGIPWMLAFALRADGWWLRQEIIWHKPNPMPESVRDRCTKAHEQIFLLAKSKTYYCDMEAIKEPVTGGSNPRGSGVNPKSYKTPDGWDTSKGRGGHGAFHREGREDGQTGYQHKTRPKQNDSFSAAVTELVDNRNKRSVWTIATEPFPEAHFATFPRDLVRPCILAGCPQGGRVLDPFCGSGTTLQVARELNCLGDGIEMNLDYIRIAERRLSQSVMDFSEIVE